MQLTTTNTVDGWSGVLADLSAKQATARDHTERLRAQKQELALEAAMGSPDAKRRLTQINNELAKLTLEADDWLSAIAQAEQAKKQAERAEGDAAESKRREQIAVHMEAYLKEVREIDAGLALLETHFQSARLALDAAERLMVGTEPQPLQQLRTRFGPTLAAAHFGLGGYVELGPASVHNQHRQPLERFAESFTNRWTNPAKENTNGD